MKRYWNGKDYVPNPKVEEFLSDVILLCNKYGFSIGHEDTEGSFIIYNGYNDKLIDWLNSASISGFKEDK